METKLLLTIISILLLIYLCNGSKLNSSLNSADSVNGSVLSGATQLNVNLSINSTNNVSTGKNKIKDENDKPTSNKSEPINGKVKHSSLTNDPKTPFARFSGVANSNIKNSDSTLVDDSDKANNNENADLTKDSETEDHDENSDNIDDSNRNSKNSYKTVEDSDSEIESKNSVADSNKEIIIDDSKNSDKTVEDSHSEIESKNSVDDSDKEKNNKNADLTKDSKTEKPDENSDDIDLNNQDSKNSDETVEDSYSEIESKNSVDDSDKENNNENADLTKDSRTEEHDENSDIDVNNQDSKNFDETLEDSDNENKNTQNLDESFFQYSGTNPFVFLVVLLLVGSLMYILYQNRRKLMTSFLKGGQNRRQTGARFGKDYEYKRISPEDKASTNSYVF